MGLEDFLEHTLGVLDKASLRRTLRRGFSPLHPRIELDGKSVLCLCSNNYLGLAADPRLSQALIEGISLWGAGAGASRLVSGTFDVHEQLESELAAWVNYPAALVYSSGFSANISVISCTYNHNDIIFSDSLNHASIIDGCKLSKSVIIPYNHNNVKHLREQLQNHRHQGKKALIVSDAVFSMDGDLAPVRELAQLRDEYDTALMIDEAHALGVIGAEGRGLCYDQGIKPDILIGTFGKSFGLNGAFVAGSENLRKFMINRARGFIYSTAVPPFHAHAMRQIVHLIRAADAERAHLLQISATLRAGLIQLGYDVPSGIMPIVPVLMGDSKQALQCCSALLEQGVFVQAIRPPTVPPGTARLRAVPMASHSVDDMDEALRAFADVRS